jgi:hypothetical protein
MTMICKHARTTQVGPDRCYTGSVARAPYTDDNRAAHGCVTITVECRDCGARRDENRNQGYVEVGPWGPSRATRRAEADRLSAEAMRLRPTREVVVMHGPGGVQVTIAVDDEGYLLADAPRNGE